MRRSTFHDAAVTYAAIGSTLDPDLTRYPPKGFRASEKTIRLGSGEERYRASVESLLTWGVQRGANVKVTDIVRSVNDPYTGISFNQDGSLKTDQNVTRFSQTNENDDDPQYVMPGMSAILHLPFAFFSIRAPIRVIYRIDEDTRQGFAYGTMPGHPLAAEEAFIVELRDDGTVWLRMRTLLGPGGGTRRILWPFFRALNERFAKRYLRALHPVGSAI